MAGELVTVALSLMLQVGQPIPQYGTPVPQYGNAGVQFGTQVPQYAAPGPQYNAAGPQYAAPGPQFTAAGQPMTGQGQQVGSPGPSETPNYPALQNAFSQHGHEGQFEQRYPFDSQQNWVHGYFQDIPAYGGHVFFRPYNYKDVMSQSQTAAGWGMSPTMPYSQQFWHRYHDQATMLKLSRSNPGQVPAPPTMQPGYPAPQPAVLPAGGYYTVQPQISYGAVPMNYAPAPVGMPVQTAPMVTSGPFLAPQ